MAETMIIPCGGLQTDPNAAVPPPGGMRRAVNVVIDAPGVATARPNFNAFKEKSVEPPNPDREIHSVTVYDTRAIVIADGGGPWYLETEDAILDSGAEFAPPDIQVSHTQWAKARRNLYFTTSAGVRKLTSASGVSSVATGMHAPGQLLLSLGTTPFNWFPASEHVAYRACFVKVDANGLETRSPPSGYLPIQNTTAGLAVVVISVPLPPYALEGDTLEIYRSLAVASPPPADSMFLALTHELTATDITNGFVLLTDNTSPTALGQMLYTSAGREGIEGANNPPPTSIALTVWGDSLWTGAVTYPAVLEIDLARPWVAPGETAVITASVTIGSPIATVSSATNIRPGQRVNAPGVFPAGTSVLSVVGTTVTMDANALVTNASAAISFWDVFVLDGLEYFGATTSDFENRRFRVEVAADPGEAAVRTARNFARAITRGSGGTLIAYAVESVSASEAWPRFGRIFIQRTNTSTAPLVFDETAATVNAFDPVDPIVGFTGTAEQRPHRIAYSKPQEPEHFRLLDWIEIGREDARVIAFAPLAHGLLVYKEDGVWSVSGTYPTFAVDKVSEAVLLRGACVDTFEDIAYAWCDRGMLAMSERGTMQSLSDGKIREELRVWSMDVRGSSFTTGNAWLQCWDALSIVVMGTCDHEGEKRTYCLSTLTGEWSRWDLEMRSPFYDEALTRLVYGRAHDETWELRHSQINVRGYDGQFPVDAMNPTSDTTFEILEADANTWEPKIGDWILRQEGAPTFLNEWRRIIASHFDSGLGAWVIEIDRPFDGTDPVVSILGREGARAVLEWQRHGMSPPSNAGYIRELQVHVDVSGFAFSSSPLILMAPRMRVIGGAHSDRSDVLATLLTTPLQREAATRPIRFGVPRAHARSTHLYPYVEINEAYRWRCLGIALVGEQVSSRLTRGVPP